MTGPGAQSVDAAAVADPLRAYRDEIDRIDREVVALLNRRAEIALKVGQTKADANAAVFAPDREEQVYANIRAANAGPLPPEALKTIYREVISSMRALEQHLTVAFFGPVHTFTHQAALSRFGTSSHYVAARTVAEVFSLTEKGSADYGVVPVENSTGGMVPDTLDLFVTTELQICAEIMLPIHHQLMAVGDMSQIRHVYSHPQSFAQCRNWLALHLPNVDLIEASSNARAVELAREDASSAAIGPEIAARAYGLTILASNIEDSPMNVTRFLVLGKHMGRRSGTDKTAVLFSIRDKVGALRDALDVFERYGINLTKIESRPSRRKVWDYVFFVDFVGHPEDPHVAKALDDLCDQCLHVKVLGAWSQSELGPPGPGF